jgi:hypothetical protein
MAGYTLKMHREDFRGGRNILASTVGLKFVNVGITLDADAIGEKHLPVGTAVMRNATTNKYEEYADDTGEVPAGYDDFLLLNVDVDVDGENDVIVGEAIVNGDVYEAKLPNNVTAAFKAHTNARIRYVKAM